MAVDAMEVLITHPDVGTFMLVAGDGDYSSLVQRLREFGKRVVGVGTKASASARPHGNYWTASIMRSSLEPIAPPAHFLSIMNRGHI
jgi:uncharacterized LabA/DUF88 family protein